MLGTGGCALMMPVIRFGFRFDPALAVGTTLTAVVFTAASGALQHWRMKNVDAETSLLTGYSGILGVIIGSIIFGYLKPYGALIGAIFGARLVAKIRPHILKALFGLLFLYVSLKYILIYFGIHI